MTAPQDVDLYSCNHAELGSCELCPPALPDHEDETDCPDPRRCRAHSWVLR